jgi:demethylmenaquinone methyltransferase/2-methoxy-6-polyprenyl-1,4-benzoquinol methylase
LIDLAEIRHCEIASLRSQRRTPNVRCQVSDAYTLDGIEGRFNAAFAHWWWSHIPKSRISTFLNTLHSKLQPGAVVLFIDQLPYPASDRYTDDEGNTLEVRQTPDDRTFEIIKNFPSEIELRNIFSRF